MSPARRSNEALLYSRLTARQRVLATLRQIYDGRQVDPMLAETMPVRQGDEYERLLGLSYRATRLLGLFVLHLLETVEPLEARLRSLNAMRVAEMQRWMMWTEVVDDRERLERRLAKSERKCGPQRWESLEDRIVAQLERDRPPALAFPVPAGWTLDVDGDPGTFIARNEAALFRGDLQHAWQELDLAQAVRRRLRAVKLSLFLSPAVLEALDLARSELLHVRRASRTLFEERFTFPRARSSDVETLGLEIERGGHQVTIAVSGGDGTVASYQGDGGERMPPTPALLASLVNGQQLPESGRLRNPQSNA